LPSPEQNPRELQIVAGRRMKSPASTEELRGLHGLWWSLYEAAIVLALVNGHEAPLLVCGDIEKCVWHAERFEDVLAEVVLQGLATDYLDQFPDRKSTRLNSSHGSISYAVFC